MEGNIYARHMCAQKRKSEPRTKAIPRTKKIQQPNERREQKFYITRAQYNFFIGIISVERARLCLCALVSCAFTNHICLLILPRLN